MRQLPTRAERPLKEDEAIATIRRYQPPNLVRYLPHRRPWAGRKEWSKGYTRDRRTKRRMKAIALLGNRCLDCGVSFPNNPEVYDFDHARGTKETNVSHLFTASSWQTILKELNKCDLVCSNCHRIRTAQRAEWPITKTGVSNTPLNKKNGCE